VILSSEGLGAYVLGLCKTSVLEEPPMGIKASVFIATSLDGFIARANGDLDWLTGVESASTEQDYGYQEFMGFRAVLPEGGA
jgi:hypothetical protein